MSKVIGIDLGTTFSVVAFVDEHGHADTILNTDSQPVTASALWIDEDGNMIVGQLALDNAVAFPEDIITMAKRSMGQQVILKARGKEFTPPEVSAIILKKLKQDAERHLGEPVTDVVITCPAFFGADETQATKLAGEMAGFNVRRILAEPEAAALAFGYDNPTAKQTVLVYDLGGGTFDITLFKVGPPVAGFPGPEVEMISTGGDRQLGGADWDTRVVDWVAGCFVDQQLQTNPAADPSAIDPRMDPGAKQDLVLKVERAKKALSKVAKTTVVCQHLGVAVKVELTRDKMLELTKDLLDGTERAIDELLEAKGYRHDQIDQVLCAGGSTRLIMVRDMLQRKFPGRVNTNIEADLCVAHGAAQMARLIQTGAPIQESSLTPHAYGVLANDPGDNRNWVYPVILKDQKLPAASARYEQTDRPDHKHGGFVIAQDGQTRVVLRVFEFDALSHTEKREPESCREIGSVVLDVTQARKDDGIFTTFEMDLSRQLTVSALHIPSGATKTAVLTIGKDAADAETIRKNAVRVAEMKRRLGDTEVGS